MNKISIFDLLVLAAIAGVLPILGAVEWRRFKASCASPEGAPRLALYRSTMVQAWLVALAVLALFLLLGRQPAELGIRWPSGPLLPWALLIAAGLAGALLWGLHSARHAEPEQRARVRQALGSLAHFMPRGIAERRAWSAMSVTAGITEELVFRGYLLWVFAAAVPTGWAIALASLLFGLQHAYQGLAGIVRTALLGAALSGLYLASNSLLLPILAHILIDLLQGATLRTYLSAKENCAPSLTQ